MTAISGYANRSMLTMQMLTNMRWQLDDLQRQLATGKRADTYGALGIGRTMDLEARMRLSRVETYETAIYSVDLRVGIMNTALDRLRVIGEDTRGDMRFPATFELNGGTQTQQQQLAGLRLDEALSLLNERAGERYLFSGRATDAPATDTAKHILDGNGALAGLKQVISERLLADRGADGRGRLLTPSVAGDVITLEEDGAHPFGFKLSAVTTDFGATVTPTAGPPASFDIDLGGANPPEGGRIQVRLTLPDGSSRDIELVATTEDPPPSGTFLIGVDSTATAANIAGAIDAQVLSAGTIELVAASAVQAGEDFFAIDAGNPPQRVDGPPFESATAMRSGAADTVSWYVGDAALDTARDTAIARVDEAITVSYGARANENGIRQVVQATAVFASVTFSESDPNARDRYFALLQRLGNGLDGDDGLKKIEAIQTDLAGASLASASAKERLADKKPILQGIVDEIENISAEEVGVKLLALNTRMQATMQTTAILSQFTLLSYL